MKLMVVVSSLTLSLSLSAVASAAVKKPMPVAKKAAPTAAAPATAASKKKLSNDISFSGSQVDGKYLSAGESVAEIEGDKEMGALIGIRKNFRDRLKEEKARLEAQTSPSASSGKGQ